MRSWAIISLLVVTSSFAGCLGEEEVLVWPDPESWDCSIEESYNLSCYKYLDGFSSPISSLKHPTNDEIWIVELSGLIHSWDGTEISEIADLSSMVSTCHVEQGLLGMAFADGFDENGTVLLSYVEEGSCDGPNESDLVLSSAGISPSGELDVSSIKVLKSIEQPYRNHNGGHLLNIGGSHFLWGVGDGGNAYDPEENGQNPSTELGTILQFSYLDGEVNPVLDDPVGDPYVLHHGLRNPWRFDLDSHGRLWISDVGQNCWEEVNLVSLENPANLGWAEMEGDYLLDSSTPCGGSEANESMRDAFTGPIATYSHSGGNCSITGGFWMDWGPIDLDGGYLYGDFCSGSMWILKEEDGSWDESYIGSSGGMIVGFGEGLGGELLVFHWTGEIVHIG